jgi:nitrous oxidase accessory protein NosD
MKTGRIARKSLASHKTAIYRDENMLIVSRALMFGAAFAIALAHPSSEAATAKPAPFFVGSCKPGKGSFLTIQSAINSVPAGSTISICPGLYPEQLTITQAVTLQGMQSANQSNVIIALPPGGSLAATIPTAIPLVAQIGVSNSSGPVNIIGITVDGTGLTNTMTQVAAIAYNSSPGLVSKVVVQNLVAPQVQVFGVIFRDDAASSPTDSVENSVISFSASGDTHGLQADTFIDLDTSTPSGGTIALTMSNNFVAGARVGLLAEAGVSATISGNVLDGTTAPANSFGFGTFANTGPLKFTNNTIENFSVGVSLALATNSTAVTGNTLVTRDIGIDTGAQSGSTTITGNQLITAPNAGPSSLQEGIELRCGPEPTMRANIFVGSMIGLADVPSGSVLQSSAGTFVNVATIQQLCP